jgi:hypothetical protein
MHRWLICFPSNLHVTGFSFCRITQMIHSNLVCARIISNHCTYSSEIHLSSFIHMSRVQLHTSIQLHDKPWRGPFGASRSAAFGFLDARLVWHLVSPRVAQKRLRRR